MSRRLSCLALCLAAWLPGACGLAGDLRWRDQLGFRAAEVHVATSSRPLLSSLPAAATGILFTNSLAQHRQLTNQILLNGAGVACGDVDGDGRTDLYFCALDGPNALYRNLGDWKFEDVTRFAGVACAGFDSTGAVLADLDGDRDLDLIVSTIGAGTHVFFNDGKGRFTASRANPLNGRYGGMSMALADIDGNGTLDLYLTNYRRVTLRDQPNTRFSFRVVEGKPEVTSIDGRPLTDPEFTNRFTFRLKLAPGRGTFIPEEHGEPDAVFLNDGRGNFTALPFAGGAFVDEAGQALTAPPFDWGLSVIMRDLNNDGAPDIYVCNDFKSPDRVWLNDGKGRFRALPMQAIRQTSLSSMGVDVADVNRDGHDDIFVLDMLSRDHQRRQTQKTDINPDISPPGDTGFRMQAARNTLLLARGDGTYADIAYFAGVEAAEWAWTPVFLDVDLDGYEDLLVANGFERDGMNVDVLRRLEMLKAGRKMSPAEQLNVRTVYPRLDTPNAAFRNLGNLRFADVSALWQFDARGIAQGMALADLDNDGDLDIVINNLNQPPSVYRNDAPAPRIAVRLNGLPPNTRGIGARITVTGGPVPQTQEMISGGRYLSSDDAVRVFAAGTNTGTLAIEVVWRSGRRSVAANLAPNAIYEIHETGATDWARPVPSTPVPLFADVSASLAHRHVEEPFDDFARQPLLPNKLSQLGPGMCWFDLDADGLDDLIVGSGRGGMLSVHRNEGNGRWKRLDGPPFNQPVTRDQTSVLAWRNAAGAVSILAGSANYEDGLGNGSVARHYDLTRQTVFDTLPGQPSSTGPLAMADIDGDGVLDLFVGGRVVRSRYPEAASSLVFRQANGEFAADAENTRALEGIGLVSGAVFGDIDGDGAPDLLLACEWSPVRVFRNRRGRLIDATAELGLNRFVGWWNGIATGDFDGDGRLDLVASNWGENTRHEMFRAQPLRAYHGDLDGDGTVDLLEAFFDPQSRGVVPIRNHDAVMRAMPWLRERFPTWEAFSKARIEDVLGERARLAKMIEAQWLSTTVFLNRGDRFEPVRLPDEAQFAPAFGVCVADFDGDGAEDIFLAQNFFATTPDATRLDAGRGLLLRGDGKGRFTSVAGQESGIIAYGEQRGAAIADFDGDGRVDIALGQNAAETKLFQNRRAVPGLRIRLNGPPGNREAIGAVIRLGNGRSLGPARAVHRGSGYWSQDSAVQVMARGDATVLVLRWPGGRTTTNAIPRNAREVSVDAAGGLAIVR